ncbi:MAG: hypothetical protein IJ026_00500 [Candidatus Methanomethylophilaceae archaeon]|nr:hypothetical protein [Candidatus Methanomethylophilaceae archaeon]
MATVSFDRALIIDSDQAAENFIRAMDAADARGTLGFTDLTEELRRGDELIRRGIRLWGPS